MNERLAWTIALAVMPLCAAAQEKVLVALPVTFAFESAATAQLRKDCALSEQVGRQVLDNIKGRVKTAEAIDDLRNAGETPVLRVWITHVQPAGAPSAIPSDSQSSMAIRAELYLASERGMVGDWRAASGAYSGESECGAYERIAVTLGKYVATWLPMALRVSAANRAAAEAAAKPAAQ